MTTQLEPTVSTERYNAEVYFLELYQGKRIERDGGNSFVVYDRLTGEQRTKIWTAG